MRARRLTIDQARRAALGAQGFAGGRPSGRIDVRHFRKIFETIGLLPARLSQRHRAIPLPAGTRQGGQL